MYKKLSQPLELFTCTQPEWVEARLVISGPGSWGGWEALGWIFKWSDRNRFISFSSSQPSQPVCLSHYTTPSQNVHQLKSCVKQLISQGHLVSQSGTWNLKRTPTQIFPAPLLATNKFKRFSKELVFFWVKSMEIFQVVPKS